MSKPTIETLAGLYRAAQEQQAAADRARARVTQAISDHGYTVEEIEQAIEQAKPQTDPKAA